MDKPCCKRCRFWEPSGTIIDPERPIRPMGTMAFPNYRGRQEGEAATSGWCHRRAPQVVFSQLMHRTQTEWPKTRPKEWCGEFEEANADATA